MNLSALRAAARRQAPLWLALVTTGLGLAASFLLKWPCTQHPWDGTQYRRLCYNDIQPLFHIRGIGRGVVPYSGEAVGTELQIEYPVVTGMFMDVAGRVLRVFERLGLADNSDPDYFFVSVLLLAPFAFIAALKLRRHVTAGRLLLWTIGPPIAFYSFHNWDLIPVAGAVWGLVDSERRRGLSAGAGFGIGASAKLYPAFILPGALLDAWADRDRRRAVRIAAGFVVSAALLNIPWMIRSFDGWLAVWKFHSRRHADFGTVWHWIGQHGASLFRAWPTPDGYRDFISLISLLLFAGGFAFFLLHSWRRGRRAGRFPVAAAGLGIIAVFLLVSKVHSPQYALWVVPFLVLLNVPRSFVFFYLAADAAVYISGFYWFAMFADPEPVWRSIFEFSVFARAAALGALAWWATRAERLKPAA